jgi:hypothetical protein
MSANPETNAGSTATEKPNPGDDATPGTPGTGEDICPKCQGTGLINEVACQNCGGTGIVIKGMGGG